MYGTDMDVAVSELRAHLSDWVARAREGQEVVITERGTPVARLLAVDATPALDRLVEQGLIARPVRQGRPLAVGQDLSLIHI